MEGMLLPVSGYPGRTCGADSRHFPPPVRVAHSGRKGRREIPRHISFLVKGFNPKDFVLIEVSSAPLPPGTYFWLRL